LLLQLGVGPALFAVKGWASAETERAFTRAWELCELVGDSAELFPGLVGLWAIYLVRGDLKKSNELAERVLRLARVADDPALLLYARHILGVSSYYMGEVTLAAEHLEIGISISDPKRQGLLDSRYLGFDVRMGLLSMHAISQFSLGYADQALKRVFEALALAQTLSHPFSLAFAECWGGFVRQYRREVGAAQEVSESLIALSNEQGLADFLAWANNLHGWAISAQGRNDEGIRQMQEGVAASRVTGAGVFRPYFLTLLAEACMQTNRLYDGLNALTEALAIADEHENRHYEAETHRLKGELLLKQDRSKNAEARQCFEKAIEIARKQSARSWELRATTSLARLLASQGRRDEARAMLAEIYNWFTEGFDTADLKDAKSLLDELGA
jgi:predicted ATPase